MSSAVSAVIAAAASGRVLRAQDVVRDAGRGAGGAPAWLFPAVLLLAGAVLIGIGALQVIRTRPAGAEAREPEGRAGGRRRRASTSDPPRELGAGDRRIPWSLASGVGLALLGAALLSVPRRTAPAEAVSTATRVARDEGIPIDPVEPARVAELETRVARDSSDYAALVILGHAYLRVDDLPRTAAVTTRALNLRPESPESAEPYAHMAMVLWAAERDSQALESIEFALQLQPDLPEALLYQGMLLVANGRDMPGGIAAWERYLRTAPPGANTERVRTMLDAARSAR